MPEEKTPLPAWASPGLRAGLRLVFLAALFACCTAQSKVCSNCFTFPNRCPLDTTFNTNEYNFNPSGSACPTSSRCCTTGAPTCQLATVGSGCCSFFENFCTSSSSGCSGSQRRFRLSTSSLSRVPFSSSSRCSSSSCTSTQPVITCPPNYDLSDPFVSSFVTRTTLLFCMPQNCDLAPSGDCTTCSSCLAGYRAITDGSCQLPPLLIATVKVASNANINSNLCSQGSISITTNPGQATGIVTVGGVATPRGNQAFNGTVTRILNVTCSANNTANFALPPGDTPRSVMLPVGVNLVGCNAVDMNGLFTVCFNVVNVTDQEPPVVTCNNATILASTAGSTSTYVWGRSPNATDNVAINARSSCTGGPGNNIFTFGAAPTRITCAAYDNAGNNRNCSYHINVVDRTPPVLTCPTPAAQNTDLNANSKSFTYSVAVFDNIDGGSPVVTCSHPSGSAFSIGLTPVTCSAVDSSNNLGTCSFNVTVRDLQPPIMACPSVFQPSTDATASTATLQLNATATDNSLGVVTISCTPGGLPAAYTFPLGTTPVTCTAVDPSGNPNTCSYSVTVVDRIKPTMTCTSSTLSALPGRNFSNISSYAVTAADNINVTSLICTPLSAGSQYPIGQTAVSCSAGDAAGNVQTCSLTVTVVDTEAPTVTCPSTARYGTISASNTVNFTRPVATDNLRVVSTTLVVSYNNTDTNLVNTTTNFTMGTYGAATFTFRAFDAAGSVSICFWTITTFDSALGSDDIPPVIANCPSSIQFTIPVSPLFYSPMYNSSVIIFNYSTGQGSDNVAVTLPTLSATDSSGFAPSVSYLEWSTNPTSAAIGLSVGSYVVAYSATDRVGNVAYCVYRIIVADIIPPVVVYCPPSRTLATSGGQTTVNPTTDFSYWPTTGMRFTDNFRIDNPNGTCSSSPPGVCPLGGTPLNWGLGLGNYSFNYTAVDFVGNVATPCRFTLTITDGDAPSLLGCTSTSLPQINTDPGKATANISSLCPNITAVDNFPGVTVQFTSSPAGYNCSTPIPITTTPVFFTIVAVDASGNPSSPCFLALKVRDNEPPVLRGCNSSTPLIVNAVCDPGLSTAVVFLPSISATDNTNNVTLSLSSLPTGYGNGSAYPMGSTSVTVTARDLFGLTSSCLTTVVVRDTQPPVVLGFPSNTSNTFAYVRFTDPGLSTSAFDLPTLSATDNVGLGRPPTLTINPSITGNNFPVGVTLVTYTAFDTSSLNASVTITVTVRDNEPPSIIGCPSSLSTPFVYVANTSLGQPTARVEWSVITAHDNVDGDFSIPSTSFPPGYESGSLFRVGTTTITYTATDSADNSNTCVFSVRVTDNQVPRLTCPDNVTVTTADVDSTVSELNWPPAVASDNNRLRSVEPSLFPGLNYTVGYYNITYIATDVSGNINTCTFYASILQFVPPAAAASSSSSSAATFGAAGGAGLILILLVLLVVFVVLTRRRNKKKLQAASSGYAELMKMSDDFILERAKSIQDALMEQRMASPPAAVNAQYIHPERKFTAPPTGLAELEEYMRSTVNKELMRDLIEFGAELGAGEFGAVYEGFYLRPNPKLKVAIKMLKKATSDDDKGRFLKEAAIMAQFNHPNICSLVGVCTLPTTEPTLIVLEYMHLGALHGYLQSPMVYEKLETLTMLRMALDVGCGMQYLAEAGFVHRDLAARNILLDKTMTCRVGDFGLSVDLSEGEAEDGGVYSGQEGAKIPIRWTAIEAVCFRQFSTASDVWSYGVLLWEIWSYAELPYRGWANKKVTEEVSAGFRLPKPAHCPDEVYRIMIDCWNKNVKRRITFQKINEALVEIWHDLTREDGGHRDEEPEEQQEDAPEGNMLYDNSATQMAPDSSDEDEPAPAPAPVAAAPVAPVPNPPAAVDDDDLYQIDEPVFNSGDWSGAPMYSAVPALAPKAADPPPAAPKAAAAATVASQVYLYSEPQDKLSAAVAKKKEQPTEDSNYVSDLKDLSLAANAKKNEGTADIYTDSAAVAVARPKPTPPPTTAPPMQMKLRAAGAINELDVGQRVLVKDFCGGVLRFFGPHAKDGKPRCGVELDEPIGLNNGTAGGHKYFECEMKRGVLVDPRVVLLEKAKPAGIIFNPIYDSITIFKPSLLLDSGAEPPKERSGYLAIGENPEPMN